jgi:tRNA(Ile)-lysidine synthase
LDLLKEFDKAIAPYHLAGQKLLLAVSGGVDSVVLTDLCSKHGLHFIIAHCNFQLRGEESERDEAFVRSLGEKYQKQVFVERYDTYAFAEEENLSIQEAARKLRYDFFDRLRREHECAYTLLAHHANDQIETVLMNFFRGTGLEGLTGMPEQNKLQANALRPMLHFKRKDILQYAQDNNLTWVDDSSNESVKYTRNLFRNELLPAIAKVYPQVEDNLLDNIDRLQKTNKLYKELVENLKTRLLVKKGNEIHIPVLQLMKYADTSLIYEVIKDYGFSEKQVEEVVKLSTAESGKYIANDQYRIIKHRHWFIIAPYVAASNTIVIDEGREVTYFPGGEIKTKSVKKEKFKLDKSEWTAQLDAGQLEWPLLFRRWKTADYFYPLGMKKKKKLSRFFIDQKLSKSQKENIWVVESNKKIIWVAGYRIDDRYKVVESTKEVLEISIPNP